MLFSTLFLILGLALGTRADWFILWSDDEAKLFSGGNTACAVALTSKIMCHTDLIWLWNNNWRGPNLGNDLDSNGTETENICMPGCAASLQVWYRAVDKYCPPGFRERGDLLEGQKLFCDRDPKTGKYCQTTVDQIYEDPYFSKARDLKNKEEFPRKYLCVLCYARRVFMTNLSGYNPASDYWRNQRQRIENECPKSILDQISATATFTATRPTPTVTDTETETSTTKKSTSINRSTFATEATATASAELSPGSPEKATQQSPGYQEEPSPSPETNVAGKVGQGQLYGYWSWTLLLLVGMHL